MENGDVKGDVGKIEMTGAGHKENVYIVEL